MYYFRARWYDPITARWLSNDPIGISGGLNQYLFCGDNPVNCVDPFGLADLWINGEYHDIQSLDQFEAFVFRSGRAPGSITSFQFKGHGNLTGGLEFGNDTLTSGLMWVYLSQHKGLFSDNSKFYLEGCATLNPNYAGYRVADSIKHFLPGSEVWGFTGLSMPAFLVAGPYVGMPRFWLTTWRIEGGANDVPRWSHWQQLK